MKTFSEFANETLEESLITEALNNPVEYYMTDDTVIPTKVFGAFDIDGNKYVMALQAADQEGMYILEIGKTSPTGGKVVWWKFHNSKDIVRVLATSMHFAQASTAILGPKLKGVAIRFRNNTAQEITRAARITTRILKRSYISSFKVVDVAQPEKMTDGPTKSQYKLWRHVFVTRKGVSPSSLFTGNYFKKYDFNGNGAIPEPALSGMKTKTPPKQVIKTTPSKKFSFGQFEVDTPGDQEIFDKVQNVKASKGSPKPVEEPKSENNFDKDFSYSGISAGLNSYSGVIQGIPGFNSMVNALKKYGYDESKFDEGNLKYVVSNLKDAEKEILKKCNLWDGSNVKDLGTWRAVMKKIADPSGSPAIQSVVQSNKEKTETLTKKYSGSLSTQKPKPTSASDSKITSNVSPDDFTPTMPGSGSSAFFDGQAWQEPGVSVEKKLQHISYELGYYDELKEAKGFTVLRHYTGSAYDEYNDPLRSTISKLFKGEPLSKQEITNITGGASKFQKLAKMFENIKPLPESLWVYRGSNLYEVDKSKIEPGYDFVDPAFMSTSLRPNISFGKHRMRIFLPKGSKVLPILGQSKIPSEKEIVLPPSSVIRVIEVEQKDSRIAFQGVFMGSAFKSITQMLKKQLTLAEEYGMYSELKGFIEMMEEKEKYSAEDKFGGPVHDTELSELIKKAIKSGKVELDKPEEE